MNFYGIKSDTRDLAREAKEPDKSAFLALYPRVLLKILSNIEHPKISIQYVRSVNQILQRCLLYTKDTIIANIENLPYPEIIAEISDYLIQIEGIKWVFCIGEFNKHIFFSIRTSNRRYKAGEIATKIVKGLGSAGGHNLIAGGDIKTENLSLLQRRQLANKIEEKFLKTIGKFGKNYVRLLDA